MHCTCFYLWEVSSTLRQTKYNTVPEKLAGRKQLLCQLKRVICVCHNSNNVLQFSPLRVNTILQLFQLIRNI